VTDESAIEATVLDYFESWGDGDAGRMEAPRRIEATDARTAVYD
jgi:hypothetical protein